MTNFSVIKQILQNISYTNITHFLKNKILPKIRQNSLKKKKKKKAVEAVPFTRVYIYKE